MVNFLQRIFDVRSKTFIGVLLGVVALLMDSSNFLPDLPKGVLTAIEIVGFALAFFGLVDAAEQSEKDIIERAKAFFSDNIAAGLLLEVISHLIDTIPTMPNVPQALIVAAQIIGAILMAMGLRKKIAQGRTTTVPPAPLAIEKYKHLLQSK